MKLRIIQLKKTANENFYWEKYMTMDIDHMRSFKTGLSIFKKTEKTLKVMLTHVNDGWEYWKNR